MQRRALVAVLAALAGAGWVVGASVVSFSPPERTVRIGEPVRQDDFTYAVVGVARTASLGAGAARVRSQGFFYVVTIEVANHALRVDYRWDPSIAYVVDARGARYAVSIEAQRLLDALHPTSAIIPAGASARFSVAFDLPADVVGPQLGYSNGILMGDLFDGAAYRGARVPLE